jgi:transcriptional regulator with XRE-family HTH domain
MNMDAPNHIRFWRQQRGLTLQQLAEASDTTRAQIDKLERGLRRLTVDWMVRLARPLGCDPRSLMLTAMLPADSTPQTPRQRPHTALDLVPLYQLESQPRGQVLRRAAAPHAHLPRPYFLTKAPQAYGLIMPHNRLQPVLSKGQSLWLNPHAAPKKLQPLALLRTDGTMLLGLFLRRTTTQVTLRLLQPQPRDIIVPSVQLIGLHPVIAVIAGA